jgi:hypothetical protein
MSSFSRTTNCSDDDWESLPTNRSLLGNALISRLELNPYALTCRLYVVGYRIYTGPPVGSALRSIALSLLSLSTLPLISGQEPNLQEVSACFRDPTCVGGVMNRIPPFGCVTTLALSPEAGLFLNSLYIMRHFTSKVNTYFRFVWLHWMGLNHRPTN